MKVQWLVLSSFITISVIALIGCGCGCQIVAYPEVLPQKTVPLGAVQEAFGHQFLSMDTQLEQEPQKPHLLEENGEVQWFSITDVARTGCSDAQADSIWNREKGGWATCLKAAGSGGWEGMKIWDVFSGVKIGDSFQAGW